MITGAAVSSGEKRRHRDVTAHRPQTARIDQRGAEQEERHEQFCRAVGVEAEREQRPGGKEPARPPAHPGRQRREGEQKNGRKGDELEGDAAEVHVPRQHGEQQRGEQPADGAERDRARADRCRSTASTPKSAAVSRTLNSLRPKSAIGSIAA